MPNIPTTYTDLPGFVAGQYDIQMVRLALALSDVLTSTGFKPGSADGVDYLKQSMGAYGCVTETGVTAVTGDFCSILFIEDTIFSLITISNQTGDSITGKVFKAGSVLLGGITAFTLTSGSVVAYKAS